MPEIAAPPSPPEPRYWAFISYSHADQKHARSLHKRMEAFRGHKKLVGTIGRGGAAVPPRAYPIFLDRDELEGAADLAGRINDALRASRFLIVICSPRAARSRYVDQEIAFFKSLGREDRVLALIVAGEPHAADRPELGLEECFPPSLKLRIGHDGQPTGAPAEPLAADLRPGKDDPHDALLKILAGVLGLGFDDLRRRDQQRRLRLRTLWSGLATVLALVFLGLAISAYVAKQEATRQGQIALARQLAAQSELARADPQRSRESLELALRATEVLAGQEGARSFDVDAALRRSLALTPRQVPAPDAGPAMPASTGASAAEPPLREEGLLAINAQAGLTATAAPDGVHVTEVATGRQTVLAHPRDPDLPAAPGNTVYPHSAAFAADGKQLAVGYDYAEYHKRHYGGVTLWRLGDAPGKADGWTSDEPVSLLRYDRDGRLYWGDAQAIHIGAKRDGFTIPGAGKDGLFAINEGGDRVATASAAGLIRLWDVKDHQEQWRLGPGAEARGLRFIEDTGTLAVTDASGRASFWPAQASAFSEETFAVPATAPPGSQLLALNPDAGLLMSIDHRHTAAAAAVYVATFQLLKLAGGQPLGPAISVEGTVALGGFSADGHMMVTAMRRPEPALRVWDAASGKPLAALPIGGAALEQLQVSADGQWIVFRRADKSIWSWSWRSAASARRVAHGERFAVDEARQRIAVASEAEVRIWRLDRPAEAPLRLAATGVRELAFSPDGEFLATELWDGPVWVWQLARAERVGLVEGLSGDGRLDFIHDGSALAKTFNATQRSTPWALPALIAEGCARLAGLGANAATTATQAQARADWTPCRETGQGLAASTPSAGPK